jgi:hypothetical protein
MNDEIVIWSPFQNYKKIEVQRNEAKIRKPQVSCRQDQEFLGVRFHPNRQVFSHWDLEY